MRKKSTIQPDVLLIAGNLGKAHCHMPTCYFNTNQCPPDSHMVKCPNCKLIYYHSNICIHLDSKHYGLCAYKKNKSSNGFILNNSTSTCTKYYIAMSEIYIDYNDGLGMGGYSKVYKSTCRSKVFAAKIVDKAMVKDKNIGKTIAREVMLHITLRHPHIVRLSHVAEDSDKLVLLCELATYGNLSGSSC